MGGVWGVWGGRGGGGGGACGGRRGGAHRGKALSSFCRAFAPRGGPGALQGPVFGRGLAGRPAGMPAWEPVLASVPCRRVEQRAGWAGRGGRGPGRGTGAVCSQASPSDLEPWCSPRRPAEKPKLSPTNTRALTRMKQTLRKHNAGYTEQMAAFRANPVSESEASEESSESSESESESATAASLRMGHVEGGREWRQGNEGSGDRYDKSMEGQQGEAVGSTTGSQHIGELVLLEAAREPPKR